MKKYIIIGLIVILPVLSLAQGPISFGPKIGWNTTQISTQYQDYIDQMKNGVQGGVYFSIYMDKFYIQPEAYFSLKRGSLDTTIGNPVDPLESMDVSQSFAITSVDIPILLGYKLVDLKLIRLRVWGGPVASYVLDKTYTIRLDGLEQNDIVSKNDFKDAVWGFQMGAGLDVLFLTFDIGYEFGLEEFMSISSLDDLGFTNNMFYVSLGWRIF
ncbi:MAG: PorT family protein [Bacteroidales bacterium]|nr:PorT family protein [Bacteroidales bacterium]